MVYTSGAHSLFGDKSENHPMTFYPRRAFLGTDDLGQDIQIFVVSQECPQTPVRHLWKRKYAEYMAFFSLSREKGTVSNVEKHIRYAFDYFAKDGKDPNPKALNAIDILSWHQSLKDVGLVVNTRLKYIGDLGQFLEYCGNNIVKELRQRRLLPRRQKKRKPAKPLSSIYEILECAHDLGEWHGEIVAFMVAMGSFAGTRPCETRDGWFEDLNTEEWTYFVRFPKGGESYGEQRNAPIVDQGIPFIERFINVRAERLSKAKHPIDSKPLIPKVMKSKVGFYKDVRIRSFKAEVQRGCTEYFTIQEMRRSFAQTSLNFPGVTEGSIKTALGHNDEETLRLHYAAIGEARAHAEIKGAWNQYCVIEPKNGSTGSENNGPTGNRSFSWPVSYSWVLNNALLILNTSAFFFFFFIEARGEILSE